MTLVLTRAQMLASRHSDYSWAELRPRQINDGTFGVSEAVLTDPAHASVRSTLQGGSIEAVSSANYQSTDGLDVYVDGKLCVINADSKAYAITEPAANVLRFELRQGDVGYASDPPTRARSELSERVTRYQAGDTIWRAWSMRTETDPAHEIHVGQYHSVDSTIGRAPVLAYYLLNGNLIIRTRSSASIAYDGSGVPTVHYNAAHAKNTWHNFVEKVTFGETGALSIWLNGTQIVNEATVPIGYYDDAQADLAWLIFGIYLGQNASNVSETFAVRYANMEWGAADLTARIASPVAIAT